MLFSEQVLLYYLLWSKAWTHPQLFLTCMYHILHSLLETDTTMNQLATCVTLKASINMEAFDLLTFLMLVRHSIAYNSTPDDVI